MTTLRKFAVAGSVGLAGLVGCATPQESGTRLRQTGQVVKAGATIARIMDKGILGVAIEDAMAAQLYGDALIAGGNFLENNSEQSGRPEQKQTLTREFWEKRGRNTVLQTASLEPGETRQLPYFDKEIRVSSPTGIVPHSIGYEVTVTGDSYRWSLDGVPIGNSRSGRTTLADPGMYTLSVSVLTREGPREYHKSISVHKHENDPR